MNEQWKIIAVFVAVMACALLFKSWRKRIFGAGIYHALNWVFDNPLWISVELVWKERGVLAMVFAAILLNCVLLFYYRNKKAEWVLWDALDEAQEKQDFFKKKLDLWRDKKTFRSILFPVVSYVPMQLFFLLLRLLKVKFWGDMIAFFFLSIFQDAFITMTYLRHGCNNGLRIRDYMFFILSLAVSIGYWVVRNGLITELVIRPVLNF